MSALVAWWCLASAAAHAAPRRRVLLVGSSGAFSEALTVALSPWGVDVQVADEPVPDADPARAAAAARTLAQRHDASLVLWVRLTGDGGGPAAWLWVYDADTGQVAQRPLPAGPPLEPEAAAAAALTAKVMIRLTVVAPPRERFGARTAAPPRWHLDAGVELRPLSAGPTDEGLVTQSLGLRAQVTPRVSAALGLATGPGFAVDDERLIARFTRSSLTAGARVRVLGAGPLRLEPAAWLGVHRTALDGAIPGSAAPVAITRTNVSLGAGVALVLAPGGGLEVVVSAGVDVPLRRQRYLLDGEPLLELPAVEPVVGVSMLVPIL